MRIGINTLFMLPGKVGGTETYATSLIYSLAKIDHSNEYVPFVNRESASLSLVEQSNFHRVVCPFPARYRPLRYLWEQVILPWQALYCGLDVLHSLGYVSPLHLPCRSVVTIYDVNFCAIPKAFTFARRLILKYFVTQSARRATHIITGSQTARKQIVETLKIEPSKVSVVYGGVKATILGNGQKVLWPMVARRYGIEKPYVMAFSSQSHHKNIGRLLQAFAGLSNTRRYVHQLVLIGHLPSQEQLLRALVDKLGLSNKVVFTGYVQDEHVALLLANADLFIFPSLYEGFGFPALEAQRAGVAVACSTAGSLPEIAGDGAFFFDPYSVEELIGAMELCLENAELRQNLIEKGYANLERFSWEMTARETLEIYQQISTGG